MAVWVGVGGVRGWFGVEWSDQQVCWWQAGW